MPAPSRARRWLRALGRALLVLVGVAVVFVAAVYGWRAIRDSDLLYDGELSRVAASETDGAAWPFFLYVPASALDDAGRPVRLLVRPNNTGSPHDDPGVHEGAARRDALASRSLAEELRVAILVPAFPRPDSQWRLYTHALDRDAVTTAEPGLARLDLQLLAMIAEARDRIRTLGLESPETIVIQGFSASGMFANRFTLIHPDRVQAAIVGSPGGWPIVPIDAYRDQALRYPIGTSDFASIFGRPFDRDAASRVPMLFLLGANDDNDSVRYEDSYDPIDADTVRSLFGESPVARWQAATSIYQAERFQAEFKLYPDTGHELTPEMENDIARFIRRHAP